MDKHGAKPVAGRIIQTYPRTNTQTRFSGHTMSSPVRGVRTLRPRSPAVAQVTPVASSLVPVQPSPVINSPDPPAIVAAPKVPTDYPVPLYQAPNRPDRIVRKRMSRRRKVLLHSATMCFVVVLMLGGMMAWSAYAKLHKVFHGTATVAALAAKPVPPQALQGEGSGRVNILLLGIGGPGHDGPDLTDTILLLSIDPVNGKATMLSIPRDLWVDQPIPYFGKQQKINAAYESGKYHYLGKQDSSNENAAAVQAGLDNLDNVIEQVIGVTVNYHVLVNFQAFKQAIDTVGGVDVDVATPLIDPTMAWENHNNPLLAAAGEQHMDGTQALLYARSRETTSDFARGQRQRQILVALKDKVFTIGTLSNPAKIESLVNAFGDNVYSDLSTQGAERLYSIMKKIGDGNISSIGLTDPPHQLVKTGSMGNLSVDMPVAGIDNYTDIRTYVREQMPDGYIVKEDAPITILAGSTDGATVTGSTLEQYGYNITATLASSQPATSLTLVDLSDGADPYTLHYLETRYGVKAVTQLPPGVTLAPDSAKFVIIEP